MRMRRAATVVVMTSALASVAAVLAPAAPADVPAVQTRTATTGKTVALTFDDGPGPDTAAILGILARYGVRATFFNVGTQMAAHPDLVRAMAAQGHTLGDHTWDHAHLSQLTEAEQADELDRQAGEQRALVGTTPQVMRPPYGEYDDTTLALAAARGMSVWNWSCSTRDWAANGDASSATVDRIVARAEAAVKGEHPVILMHDAPAPGDPATVLALPRIIRYFRDHGYSFVDVLGQRGLAAYAPTGAAAPAAATTSGGLHVFARDRSGRLVERTHHDGRWSRPRSLAATTAFGPAAAAESPSTTLVAVTTPAGSVRVRDVGDRTPGRWSSLGGTAVGRPAVAVDRARGIAYLAVRTRSGAVTLRVRAHGRWHRWHTLGGDVVTAPAVAVTTAGTVTVAAATADGAVVVRRRTAAGWTPWRATASGSTADPALGLTPDGRHVVLTMRDAAGAIVVRIGSGSRWSALRSLGGVAASGPATTVSGARLAVLAVDGRGRVVQARATAATAGAAFGPWHSLPPVGG